MGLAQQFTKWSWMNASENFHIQLHKYIFKVTIPQESWSLTYNHLNLHMHVIPKTCHIHSKWTRAHVRTHTHTHTHTYICNNFWALELYTQTYPKGTLVNLHNQGNRVIILCAKEYEFMYTAVMYSQNVHLKRTGILETFVRRWLNNFINPHDENEKLTVAISTL